MNNPNKKSVIILLFLLFISVICYGSEISDSLQTVIDRSQGIKKVNAQLDLSYYFRRTDFDRAQALAENALDQIRLNHYPHELETKGIYHLALSLHYKQDYERSIPYLYQAMTMAQEDNNSYILSEIYFFIGASSLFHYGDHAQAINYYNLCIQYGLESKNYKILGAVYSAMSNLFRVSGSYEKSLEFIYRSRENYSNAGYREGIAWVEYTTGQLFSSVGLYEEAQKAFTRSLNIYRELGAIDGVMTGVAICLDQLSVVHTELGNWQLAKKFNREALEYYKQDGSQFGLSNALKYKGIIELKMGNFDRAESLLDSSMTIKKKLNDKMGLSSIYSTYGLLYIEQSEYRRALDSLEIGLAYAVKNAQVKNRLEIYGFLARSYEELGLYDIAFQYKSDEFSVADSIFNAKTSRNMLQLETLYEIEMKELEIEKLEHDKTLADLSLIKQKNLRDILFTIIGMSLLIILIFIYFFRSKVVSNRQLLENKHLLEESNATKDKFFSILSHDLRNPYNSILGLSQVLKQKHHTMDVEERDKLIQALYSSSNNNYNLLNNLLEWSRSHRGLINYQPESFLINDVALEAMELMKHISHEKDILVHVDGSPVNIYADKNMIQTVIRNLLSNAIKYSNPGGKIEISFERTQQHVHVAVMDNGIGINPGDIKNLFKIGSDFQIEGTAGEKGTGLGLILCKDFVDQHHGRIWAESQPGEGSTFHFTIPHVSKH